MNKQPVSRLQNKGMPYKKQFRLEEAFRLVDVLEFCSDCCICLSWSIQDGNPVNEKWVADLY
jgi:hypothetical protein